MSNSKFVYVAQLGIPSEYEDEFNHLYDTQHLPHVMAAVPGIKTGRRYKLEWAVPSDMPQYLALYELDDPDLPKTEAWKEASDKGDWKERIRPHLTLRWHGMYRRIGDTE